MLIGFETSIIQSSMLLLYIFLLSLSLSLSLFHASDLSSLFYFLWWILIFWRIKKHFATYKKALNDIFIPTKYWWFTWLENKWNKDNSFFLNAIKTLEYRETIVSERKNQKGGIKRWKQDKEREHKMKKLLWQNDIFDVKMLIASHFSVWYWTC